PAPVEATRWSSAITTKCPHTWPKKSSPMRRPERRARKRKKSRSQDSPNATQNSEFKTATSLFIQRVVGRDDVGSLAEPGAIPPLVIFHARFPPTVQRESESRFLPERLKI